MRLLDNALWLRIDTCSTYCKFDWIEYIYKVVDVSNIKQLLYMNLSG
jgi:hypothetical protein